MNEPTATGIWRRFGRRLGEGRSGEGFRFNVHLDRGVVQQPTTHPGSRGLKCCLEAIPLRSGR